MKRVIVISTSLRAGSNSKALAERFAEGARDAGNDVELISLVGKNIQFCKGCFGCQKLGATPIYYYEMSGQMKTLIDRMNAMYPLDYRFRDIYLLTTAAENEDYTPKRAESGLQGWIDCFEKAALKAHLFCGDVNDANDINGKPKLQEAYLLGQGV